MKKNVKEIDWGTGNVGLDDVKLKATTPEEAEEWVSAFKCIREN